MRVRSSHLKDCVVINVADDYEEFERIWKGNKRLRKGMRVTRVELASALETVIADGLVQAYVLSPHPPHSTKVKYDPERLDELWYYVTPAGNKEASEISERIPELLE